MGKFIAVLVGLLVGSSSFASRKTFELKMDLSIHGKHISSPRVITKAGEMAMITQEDQNQKTFIQVVATEDKIVRGKHSVLMKFVVGTIDQDGQKKIIYEPQILAFENQKAELSVVQDIALSVTANRVGF